MTSRSSFALMRASSSLRICRSFASSMSSSSSCSFRSFPNLHSASSSRVFTRWREVFSSSSSACSCWIRASKSTRKNSSSAGRARAICCSHQLVSHAAPISSTRRFSTRACSSFLCAFPRQSTAVNAFRSSSSRKICCPRSTTSSSRCCSCCASPGRWLANASCCICTSSAASALLYPSSCFVLGRRAVTGTASSGSPSSINVCSRIGCFGR
mmetsp:Transcript_17349/g.43189  ORF Transcript_17349/g.43189 Transcript_17349/m.43189 type:complete len:212 (-) Transcript_17349:1023-1658(-)